MIEIKTVEEFKNLINNNEVAVVKFGATWCGPCKSIHPVLESVSEQMTGVSFAEVDIEEVPEITDEFGIFNIPAIIIFKNGEPSGKLIGMQNEQTIKDTVSQFIQQ